jgi:hypothetical protein
MARARDSKNDITGDLGGGGIKRMAAVAFLLSVTVNVVEDKGPVRE